MNACERIVERLPAYVAGEPDEEGVAEHVAGCRACAAQQQRLGREVDGLRSTWSALRPPPDLKRWLHAAARRPGGAPAPRPVSWAVALSALAAVVAAGVGVAWWQRAQAPPGPSRTPAAPEERGAAAPTEVWLPPPPVQLEQARAVNRPALDKPGEALPGNPPSRLHEAAEWNLRGAAKAGSPRVSQGFEAPTFTYGAVQRWVYGDAAATAGPRLWTGPRLPGPTEILLGAPFLASSRGLPGTRADGAVPVRLASPDGSMVAVVLARVEPELSAPLVVPEALARALCLQQFEIPGGATLEAAGSRLTGQRCRALVRLGERSGVVEALAVGPGPAVQVARARGAVDLVIQGERPTWLHLSTLYPIAYSEIDPAGPARPAGNPPDVGPVFSGKRFSIGHALPRDWDGRHSVPGEWGCLPVLAWSDDLLAPGESPPTPLRWAHLALSGRDPGEAAVTVERLHLPGPWPVGARATLALVWVNAVAIPSAEGVSSATVGADGALTFPRVRGEAAPGLRMRLVTKEGRASWHEVPLPEGAAEPGAPPPRPPVGPR